MWNYKLEMTEWNRFDTEAVKTNELFSPAASVLSFIVWPCSSVQFKPSNKNESIFLKINYKYFDAKKQKTFFCVINIKSGSLKSAC